MPIPPSRFIALDLNAVREFAKTHTKSETAIEFGVSESTLERRHVPFRRRYKSTDQVKEDLKKALELLDLGLSLRKVAAEVGRTRATLRSHGLVSLHAAGQPVSKQKLKEARKIVRAGGTQRQAARQTGIDRVTLRKYKIGTRLG